MPLGQVSIDPARLAAAFPKHMSPVSCAVSDISLSNNLSVRGLGPHEAHRVKRGHPLTPTIEALEAALAA